jgi:hypothetical protein
MLALMLLASMFSALKCAGNGGVFDGGEFGFDGVNAGGIDFEPLARICSAVNSPETVAFRSGVV